ncbi:uncharacterized protein YndB with AHSA1/START domain [Barrientosiimonas humi]|uniref:Uncharacterized protein YndB with AHSA1/START domain n=1 Tax=Barrientosiimonas humi TaxID=999931 RepID=A0A542XBC9_9MICO|nr:SRPBCC domain-containing protein [Barrientosiimonas humi]TQL33131.1 uncharacterized protein YndB with AHSA1/START domain [Barrientosiimonas humi]CAG7573120.1 hypothetical protein BH39T_PBIAJDOK_01745 [Barrientosiimonas humi]
MSDELVFSYDLPCPAAQAFFVYVDGIGAWWPGTYTADPATFEGVTIEPRVGGRIYARYRGGQHDDWGEVTALEHGARLEHTFLLAHSSRTPSTVWVTFDDHDTGSRMVFRHGGWTSSNAFDRHRFSDWPVILGNYVEMVRASVRTRA